MATKRKPRPKVGKKAASKVTHTQMDSRVWARAMQISKKNAKRIEIISPTEVIVWNHDIK